MDRKTNRYGATTEGAIDNGDVTDAYFVRTEETLDHIGHNPHVVCEVTADQFSDGSCEIFAGLNDVIELLCDRPVHMRALPEGTPFDGGPVMYVEGNYRDFARYETALLGMLSEASGYATKASEIVQAADGTPVLSFGARHNHPATAVIMERAAYIGGVDGYSTIAAEDELPTDASGTMPHALMLSIQNRPQAWSGFNDAVDDETPRIVLVDTFTDETEEALMAYELLGDDLDGVRLDTTGSRRGDFEHIIREVRYKLDEFGGDDVDIFVSGGLGVEEVRELNNIVDGFGIGSAISDAPSVDFSLDIVEVEGNDTAKRGKLPGMKGYSGMRTYVQNGSRVDGTDIEDARERALNAY